MKKKRPVPNIFINIALIIIGVFTVIFSLQGNFYAEGLWLYILLWISIIGSSIYDLFKNIKELKKTKNET